MSRPQCVNNASLCFVKGLQNDKHCLTNYFTQNEWIRNADKQGYGGIYQQIVCLTKCLGNWNFNPLWPKNGPVVQIMFSDAYSLAKIILFLAKGH